MAPPLASALLVACSLAAEPPVTPVAPPAGDADAASLGGFRLSLSLEAWLPRLEGRFTDGPVGVDVRTTDLHDLETSFCGALELHRDRLSIAVRGFSFSTDGGGDAAAPFTLGGFSVAAGQPIHTAFSWWAAGLELRYDLYRPLAEEPTPWSEPRAGWKAPANNTDLAVFTLLAADVESMRRSLANLSTGLAVDAKETFAAVELGGGFRLAFDTKARLPVIRRVEIEGLFAARGVLPTGSGAFSLGARVEAGITAWFCDSGALYFGYRYLGATYEGDEMTLDGSLQGLRGGVRFEF